MYKIEWKKELVLLAIMATVTVGVIISYPFLPQILPMHWNINGIVDGTAPKNIVSAFLLTGITWATYFLLLYIPFIDPKKEKYAKFLDAYRVIRYAVITVLCCIAVITTAWSLGFKIPIEKSIPALIAMELIVIGNMMGKIRINWFVGMRLPWTMDDEEVWNKTTRLAGKLLVVSGILSIVGVLFPMVVTFIVLFGSLIIATIVPMVYSIVMYRRRHGKFRSAPPPEKFSK